jgi:hypothetical protein
MMPDATLPAVAAAHVADVEAGERPSKGRAVASLIQLASDFGIRRTRRQFLDERECHRRRFE